MIDLRLDEEQQLFQETVTAFAAEQVRPAAHEADETSTETETEHGDSHAHDPGRDEVAKLVHEHDEAKYGNPDEQSLEERRHPSLHFHQPSRAAGSEVSALFVRAATRTLASRRAHPSASRTASRLSAGRDRWAARVSSITAAISLNRISPPR